MRDVSEVTNDELLDGVAAHGLDGMTLFSRYREEYTGLESLALKLGVAPDDDSIEAENILHKARFDLYEALCHAQQDGRVKLEGDQVAFLTAKEWARRLVGKTENEIEKLLGGT